MAQFDWWPEAIADRWLLTLLHFLWQGIVIAIAHALCLRLTRPQTAAARYFISLAAFILLLASPIATVLTIDPPPRPVSSPHVETSSPTFAAEWNGLADPALEVDPLLVTDGWLDPAREFTSPAGARATGPLPAADAALNHVPIGSAPIPPLIDLLYRWEPLLLAAWLVGVVGLMLRLVVSFVRTLLLIRQRLPASEPLAQRIDAIARRLHLRRTPRVCLSPRLREAIVTGYLRPLVLLPVAWATELPCEVLDAVIAHELAHIRRHDLWVILLQRLAETLLFYHPAVWILSRSLSRERELCCDALAVQATGSPLDYAAALEHVAHRLRGLTPPARWNHVLSPTLGGQKMELLNRVQHVLAMTDGRPAPGRRTQPIRFPRTSITPHGIALAIIPLVLGLMSWALLEAPPSPGDPPGRVPDEPPVVAPLAASLPEPSETDHLAYSEVGTIEDHFNRQIFAATVRQQGMIRSLAVPAGDDAPFEMLLIPSPTNPTVRYSIGPHGMVNELTPGGGSMSAIPAEAASAILSHWARSMPFVGHLTEGLFDAPVDPALPAPPADLPAATAASAAPPAEQDSGLRPDLPYDTIAARVNGFTLTVADLLGGQYLPQQNQLRRSGQWSKASSELRQRLQQELPRRVWWTLAYQWAASELSPEELADRRATSGRRFDDAWVHKLDTISAARGTPDGEALAESIHAWLAELETSGYSKDALREETIQGRVAAEFLAARFPSTPPADVDLAEFDRQRTQRIRDAVDEFRAKSEVWMLVVWQSPERPTGLTFGNPGEAVLPSRPTITYEEFPRIEMSAADDAAEQKAAKGTKMLEVRGGAIKLNGLLARDFRADASTIETGLGKFTRGAFRCTFKTARISVASNRVRGSDEFPTIQRLQLTGSVVTITGEPEYGIQADELDIEFDANGTQPRTIVARGHVNMWERQSSGVSNRVRADRMTLQLADGVPQARFSTDAAPLSTLTIEGNSVLSSAEVRAILKSPSATAGAADNDSASHPIWDGLDRLRSRLTELGYPQSTCLLELRANDDGQQARLTITEGPTAQQLQSEVRIQGRIVLDGAIIEGAGMTVRPATSADIFRGLEQRVDVEFLDTPLRDALHRLAQDHLGGQLKIDPDGLGTVGVSEQRPVNLVVRGISLRSTLKLILQPFDLDWTVTDGSLVVTSRWHAREQLQTRVYAVADLVMRPSDNPQPRPVDPSILEPLSELILSTVEPNAWSEQGGSGAIVTHPATLSLVIRARPETHQQIADLLAGLRRLQEQTGVVEFAAVQATLGSAPARSETNLERNRRLADAAYEATLTAADRQIRDRLHEPCTLEVANEPLAKVLAALSTQQQVNIVIDNAGVAECGITADQPVTLRLHDVPFETALRVLLEPHGLTHVIEDEVLKITSQLRAEGQQLVLYRCGGLLAGSPHPMPDLRRYADLIEMTIAPDSWSDMGGPGMVSMHESTSSLLVRQSPANHRQIAHLIGNLERVGSGGQPHPSPLPPQSEVNRKVFEQLAQARLAPNFQSTPLQDVMRTLAEQFAVNLWLDPHGLTEAGAAPTTPVTLSLAELPAHEALDRLLQPLGLAWCVEDGLIVVSSPRRCSGAPATQVYAVDWWLDAQADGQPARDLRTLAAEIESQVSPGSWSTTGGWGRVRWDGRTRTLIVYHTLKQQRQVASYLAGLRMQTEPAR